MEPKTLAQETKTLKRCFDFRTSTFEFFSAIENTWSEKLRENESLVHSTIIKFEINRLSPDIF